MIFRIYCDIIGKTKNGETITGDQTAWNVYGINLISRKVGADTFNYMYNGHADVTALLDTNGTVAATYYYDAFGNITEQTGSNNNYILYAGYQYDPETGLYYLNARMYDPITARFMQEDTYRGDYKDPLSLNLYTYCHNEPMMYTDPSGHSRLWNGVKSVFNSVMSSRPGRFFAGLALSAVPGFSIKGKLMMAKALLPKTFDKAAKWVSNHIGEIAAVATTIALVAGGVAATALSGGAALPVILGAGLIGSGSFVGFEAYRDYNDGGSVNESIGHYVKTAAAGFAFGAASAAVAELGIAAFGAKSAGSVIMNMAGAFEGDAISQAIMTGSVDYKQSLNTALTAGVFTVAGAGLGALSRAAKQTSTYTKASGNFRNLLADETGAMSLSRTAAGSVDDILDNGAKGAGKAPAIVGETMKRVEMEGAKHPGAAILNDMPDYASMGLKDYQVTSKMMEYNRKWLLNQMRSGRPIIDIGRDLNRTEPSIFYQMEQKMLSNYQNLHPDWNQHIVK